MSDSSASHDHVADASGFGRALVVLKPKKSRPFYARHPWVLESAVDRIEGEPTDGDIVELLNEKRKFLARGVYNSKSRIRVRLYSWDAGQGLNDDWLREAAHRDRISATAGLSRAG
ncbi:MAG: hypothetical protein QM811_05165 [Pirellulales bacterium]